MTEPWSTWMKERSKSADTQVTGDEWEELKRLRKESASLKQEREILAKATAFFAKLCCII
jgi:transposase-like protein